MTDPTQPGQPSEEEIRAYLQQVREADPAAIVVQSFQMLGEGAQVKLGRRDARVLIDSMAGITEAVADSLPEELVGQMREGVRQLQSAQVEAEGAADGDAGGDTGGAATRSAGAPTEQPTTTRPQGSAPMTGEPRTSEPQPKKSDRLWIPGR
jgi:hypothetical protein